MVHSNLARKIYNIWFNKYSCNVTRAYLNPASLHEIFNDMTLFILKGQSNLKRVAAVYLTH